MEMFSDEWYELLKDTINKVKEVQQTFEDLIRQPLGCSDSISRTQHVNKEESINSPESPPHITEDAHIHDEATMEPKITSDDTISLEVLDSIVEKEIIVSHVSNQMRDLPLQVRFSPLEPVLSLEYALLVSGEDDVCGFAKPRRKWFAAKMFDEMSLHRHTNRPLFKIQKPSKCYRFKFKSKLDIQDEDYDNDEIVHNACMQLDFVKVGIMISPHENEVISMDWAQNYIKKRCEVDSMVVVVRAVHNESNVVVLVSLENFGISVFVSLGCMCTENFKEYMCYFRFQWEPGGLLYKQDYWSWISEVLSNGVKEMEHIDKDMVDLETLNYDDLDSVSKLQKSQRYADVMQKIEEAHGNYSHGVKKGTVLQDDSEYKLFLDCNQISVVIENSVIVHNSIRDKNIDKSQELLPLMHHPIDYAYVGKKIDNEKKVTLVDLRSLLQSNIIIVDSFTGSTTKGNPQPEDVMKRTIDACDQALYLDSARKEVFDFSECKMGSIAPNLFATYQNDKKNLHKKGFIIGLEYFSYGHITTMPLKLLVQWKEHPPDQFYHLSVAVLIFSSLRTRMFEGGSIVTGYNYRFIIFRLSYNLLNHSSGLEVV